MIRRQIVSLPIGALYLEADCVGLCAVRPAHEADNVEFEDDPLLCEAYAQLKAYFEGRLQRFDLPVSLKGTDFAQSVWKELMKIPYGEVRTYGALASQLGRPSASRAVGSACGRNPLLIVVPCHRVVSSAGGMTGFSAGIKKKRLLLEHEGWQIGVDMRIKR